MNTHGVTVNFGRHKGQLLTRVPVSYLKWMVGCRHSQATLAQAELDRRGTVTPDCDISGHAIDRASLLCRKIWHENRSESEGLHAWLVRVTLEALQHGEKLDSGKIRYCRMKFVIEQDGLWPVLKTVSPD